MEDSMSQPEKNKIAFGIIVGSLLGIFGIFCLAAPGTASSVLTVLIGIGILLTSLLAFVDAFSLRSISRNWWILFLEAGVHLVLGLLLLLRPESSKLLLECVGAWAVIFGSFRMVRGVLRDGSELRILFSGLGSVAAGILLFSFSEIALKSITIILGCLMLLAGGVMIWAGIVIRKKSMITDKNNVGTNESN
jgi:uncharacterized membrane protein HdeD (DUF308 family)